MSTGDSLDTGIKTDVVVACGDRVPNKVHLLTGTTAYKVPPPQLPIRSANIIDNGKLA